MSARHPSDEDHLDGSQGVERERRNQLFERISNDPYRFVGPDREHDDADPAVKPLTGELCVLVPRDAPHQFWTDQRLRLGACNFFPEPNEGAFNEPRCPYRAVSVLAAPTVAHAVVGAFIQAHRAYPDMSRRAIVRDLRERWKPIRLEFNAVRIANLMDDRDLIGGEPQLRWSGNHLQSEQHTSDPAWTRARETLEHFAVAGVVAADLGWQGAAFRLLIWMIPFEALVEQGIVRLHPEQARPRVTRLLFLRDRRHQLVTLQLLGRSPEGRGWLARKAWRSARLSRRAIRRRRRRLKDAVTKSIGRVGGWVSGVAKDEGGWRDPDLISRATKRDIAFKTIRRLAALIAAPVVLITAPILQLVGDVFQWLHRALP
jgi:hypothetical protein